MNGTTAALLGALIGAVAAVGSGALTNMATSRNEQAQHREDRHTAYVETLRQHTAVAFTEMFALQFAAHMAAWFAKCDPRAVDQQLVSSYDTESYRAFPKLLGSMAMIAALNLRVYQELRPLILEVYRVSDAVAVALHQLESGREQAIQSLRGLLPRIAKLDGTLQPGLERIMQIAESEVGRR